MYFVPHFGHAKVYETSIWTPCFQILAKTMRGGGGGGGGGDYPLSWSEFSPFFSILRARQFYLEFQNQYFFPKRAKNIKWSTPYRFKEFWCPYLLPVMQVITTHICYSILQTCELP